MPQRGKGFAAFARKGRTACGGGFVIFSLPQMRKVARLRDGRREEVFSISHFVFRATKKISIFNFSFPSIVKLHIQHHNILCKFTNQIKMIISVEFSVIKC